MAGVQRRQRAGDQGVHSQHLRLAAARHRLGTCTGRRPPEPPGAGPGRGRAGHQWRPRLRGARRQPVVAAGPGAPGCLAAALRTGVVRLTHRRPTTRPPTRPVPNERAEWSHVCCIGCGGRRLLQGHQIERGVTVRSNPASCCTPSYFDEIERRALDVATTASTGGPRATTASGRRQGLSRLPSCQVVTRSALS
jgi:hypothetical protein